MAGVVSGAGTSLTAGALACWARCGGVAGAVSGAGTSLTAGAWRDQLRGGPVEHQQILEDPTGKRHHAQPTALASFSYARNQDSITAEAAPDAIYVLRTTVTDSGLGSSEVVSSYQALAEVEASAASRATLYPVLIRLADRGLVEACWEDGQREAGRRRHLYRLTPEGLAAATAALARAPSSTGRDPAGARVRGGRRVAARVAP